jgi:putative heme iron utilization protein
MPLIDFDRTVVSDVEALLTQQTLAVLSTHHEGQPYASLVAFAASDDLKVILFATSRSTRKYANLAGDSRVAMLVDNRSHRAEDIHEAMALTAVGVAREPRDADLATWRSIYLERHPYLESFVTAPSCALIQVVVQRYLLVRRFQEVSEWMIGN